MAPNDGTRRTATVSSRTRPSRRGAYKKWTSNDDKQIIELVAQQRDNWVGISEKFPGRTPDSCRLRYRYMKKQKVAVSNGG
jgi:hypothetical protein